MLQKKTIKTRIFLSAVLLLFITQPLWSQKSEVGFFFGTSYYLGDLNPITQFAQNRIGVGGIYRYNFNENVSIRANGFWGSISGSDSRFEFNTQRNLSFRSNIYEASLQGEINFTYFTPGNLETPSTPYIFGGAGLFRFNPQAELDGQWYDLKPLNTEGQGSDLYPDRKPYPLISTNILFGIGFKFNITQQFTGAFEWGLRRTSTDYLDDISNNYPDPSVFSGNSIAAQLYDRSLENRGNQTNFARGNPNSNDWYSFAGIVLTFRIKNINNTTCPAYN